MEFIFLNFILSRIFYLAIVLWNICKFSNKTFIYKVLVIFGTENFDFLATLAIEHDDFLIELLTIHLIDKNVSIFENH